MSRAVCQKELDRFFGGLRSHLSILEQHRAYTNRFMGDGFNLFDFIGYYENNLSDVFGKLFDRAGGHGQGTTFLSFFLDLSALKASQIGCQKAFAESAEAVRRREKVYVKREHRMAEGRLIDIVVDIGRFRLAIENTPRAGDLDGRVSHYISDLKRSHGNYWAFVYLNGYGARPSEQSLCRELRGKLLNSGQYAELGYAVPSRKWLELGWRSLRVVQPK
jgi:PD-(D/E)XK nuclease superfamily